MNEEMHPLCKAFRKALRKHAKCLAVFCLLFIFGYLPGLIIMFHQGPRSSPIDRLLEPIALTICFYQDWSYSGFQKGVIDQWNHPPRDF